MFLERKLDFDELIKGVFDKAKNSIGLTRRLRNFLPRPSLLQIHKYFARLYLDYRDIIYNETKGIFNRNLNPFNVI